MAALGNDIRPDILQCIDLVDGLMNIADNRKLFRLKKISQNNKISQRIKPNWVTE